MLTAPAGVFVTGFHDVLAMFDEDLECQLGLKQRQLLYVPGFAMTRPREPSCLPGTELMALGGRAKWKFGGLSTESSRCRFRRSDSGDLIPEGVT